MNPLGGKELNRAHNRVTNSTSLQRGLPWLLVTVHQCAPGPPQSVGSDHNNRCWRPDTQTTSQEEICELLLNTCDSHTLINTAIPTSVGFNALGTMMLLALTTNCGGGALMARQCTHRKGLWLACRTRLVPNFTLHAPAIPLQQDDSCHASEVRPCVTTGTHGVCVSKTFNNRAAPADATAQNGLAPWVGSTRTRAEMLQSTV